MDVSLLLQHLCHGCLYSLPKSRAILLLRLNRLLQPLCDNNRASLVSKHVMPLITKLVEEGYAGVGEVVRTLYGCMGEEMVGQLGGRVAAAVREMLG